MSDCIIRINNEKIKRNRNNHNKNRAMINTGSLRFNKKDWNYKNPDGVQGMKSIQSNKNNENNGPRGFISRYRAMSADCGNGEAALDSSAYDHFIFNRSDFDSYKKIVNISLMTSA